MSTFTVVAIVIGKLNVFTILAVLIVIIYAKGDGEVPRAYHEMGDLKILV